MSGLPHHTHTHTGTLPKLLVTSDKTGRYILPSFTISPVWVVATNFTVSLRAMTGYLSFISKFDALNHCPFHSNVNAELSIFI
jgi:hypothetical protein